MRAVDPTYPLYPIARFISIIMLLLVLLTSFVRQRWNFGVASICFWLFLENLSSAISAITWSDNNDVRFYTYCDIGALLLISERSSLTLITAVSRLQVIAIVVKPMATFIITRQLYLIVNVQTIQYSLAKV